MVLTGPVAAEAEVAATAAKPWERGRILRERSSRATGVRTTCLSVPETHSYSVCMESALWPEREIGAAKAWTVNLVSKLLQNEDIKLWPGS